MVTHSKMEETIVICILFNPARDLFDKWNTTVLNNPEAFFCFVDNSEKDNSEYGTIPNSVYISNHKNLGIAAAQNKGIEYAKNHDFKFVIFFDQDSAVPLGFCKQIKSEYYRIKKEVDNLCLVGPTIINKDTGQKYKNGDKEIINGYVEVNKLISTGSATKMEFFDQIGLMDERLFIDSVDFEWCWRALSKGFVCARSYNIYLPHKVGGKDGSFMGFPLVLSAPVRYYYQYRNYLLLLRRDYVPFSWKWRSGVRKLVEFFIIPFFAKKNRIVITKNMIKGIYEGIRAVSVQKCSKAF